MEEFIQTLMSNEFYALYILIGLLIVLMVVVAVVDRKQHSKKRKNTKELIQETNNLVVNEAQELQANIDTVVPINVVTEPTKTAVDQILEQPEVNLENVEPSKIEMVEATPIVDYIESEIKPNNIEKEPVKEEIKYVDESLEQTKAQQELQRLTEELKEIEDNPKNIELTNFELEQEETAIISLDELLKKGDTLYDQNEITQYEDEGNEPINLKELEERFKEQQEKPKPVTLEDFKTAGTPSQVTIDEVMVNKEEKKFKSSPVISPIYGIEKNNVAKEDSLELENTANYEKLDEEIRKTNEFLQILKELQKKLD